MFAAYIPDTTLITWYDLNTLVFGKSWLLTVITIEKKKNSGREIYYLVWDQRTGENCGVMIEQNSKYFCNIPT